jgi:hypothetical protein
MDLAEQGKHMTIASLKIALGLITVTGVVPFIICTGARATVCTFASMAEPGSQLGTQAPLQFDDGVSD